MSESPNAFSPAMCARLLEIARDLASTLDLHPLLLRIVHAAADLCEAEAASILLYEETTHELRFRVTTNLSTAFYRSVTVPENSIAGWVVRERKPLRVDDVQKDPRHYPLEVPNFTPRNLIAVPLIIRERVIGALEVLNKRQGTFTAYDEQVLSVLSAQAAVAIENARLFQQSDFVAEMVHEMRTPLNAILAAAHLLRRVELSEATRLNLAETLVREAQHLNELTTTFLDMAKLDSGRMAFEPSTIMVDSLVQECLQLVRPLAMERRVHLESHLPEHLPHLIGDRSRLKQALLNLLSNAIKYNQPGGQVTVQVEVDPANFWIHVRDTGPGIPAEHLPHLFERFYRVPGSETRATGTGLGLYLTKRLVEAHGGEVLVQSQVGHGSVFTIRLPRRPAWPPSAAATS